MKPRYEHVEEFADGERQVHPGQCLAYNLSLSFNWKAAGVSKTERSASIWRLGKLSSV